MFMVRYIYVSAFYKASDIGKAVTNLVIKIGPVVYAVQINIRMDIHTYLPDGETCFGR